jgi:hypothetical protein
MSLIWYNMDSCLEDFHADLVSQLKIMNPTMLIPDFVKSDKYEERLDSSITKKDLEIPLKQLKTNIIIKLKENFPDLILPDPLFSKKELLSKFFPINNCKQILIAGKNKGNECSKKAQTNSLCTMHHKKSLISKETFRKV